MRMKLHDLMIIMIASSFITACLRSEPAGHNWEPVLFASQGPTFKTGYDIVATPSGDIWAAVVLTHVDKGLIRYTQASQKLVTYTIQAQYGRGIPLYLFVSKTGTLWGYSFEYDRVPVDFPQSEWIEKKEWMLSRYDPESDAFVQMHDIDGILYSNRAMNILEDPQGGLWILVNDGRLNTNTVVRYDPNTNRAVKINLEMKLKELGVRQVTSLAIASDGAVWLVAEPIKRPNSSVNKQEKGNLTVVQYDPSYFWGRMLKYNPDTNVLEDYGLPPEGMSYSDFPYFDHTGRMWLNSLAWMDFQNANKPIWHPSIQPQAFVENVSTPNGNRPTWMAPYKIYESSDGMMWFTSEVGLVVHDPKKEIWTRVLDESAVVEDGNGYLWAATNSQLYRYKLR